MYIYNIKKANNFLGNLQISSRELLKECGLGMNWVGWFMVINATFNNISVISWRSVLLVEEVVINPTIIRSRPWRALQLIGCKKCGCNLSSLR